MKKIEEQQIDFEILPHNNFGKISWNDLPGCNVYFTRNGERDYFTVMSYDNATRILQTNYHGYESFTYQSSFLKSQISKIIGKKVYGYKYNIGDSIKTIKIIDRESDNNKRRKYKYICSVCGNIDWTHEKTIVDGNIICNVCSNQKVLYGFNDITTTDEWMIHYFQHGYNEAKKYNSRSKNKVQFCCPDCGRIKKRMQPIYSLYATHSIGCNCGDGISYPNKFMYNALEQAGIRFEDEYSPEWVGRRKYDFYIPDKNLIIEMDGGLGHGKKEFSNETRNSLSIDIWKDKQAQLHGINVIRINSDKSEMEYLKKNILQSGVAKVINFNKVNFVDCDKYAIKNFVKEVCMAYEKHKPISALELSTIMGIHNGTIVNYLKKGQFLGWCDYSVEEAKQKAVYKSSMTLKEKFSKPVYVYSLSGKYFGEYINAKELQRKSEEDFGVLLSYKNISRVCNGQAKRYKNFIFTFNKGEIDLDFTPRKYSQSVNQFDKEHKLIQTYDSASCAEKITNISSSNILRCCRGQGKSAGGYIWEYAS